MLESDTQGPADFEQKKEYRSDIDGLRAIAILPVVLFHAGIRVISGGYIGVDIFFVISGFLITGIIASQIDQDKFSISHFYERRIRRIFPALGAVMLFVLTGVSILYFPSDFKLIPKEIISTTLFCSNILFWSETNYFGAAAHVKPLLHTWSLAVEEQFYIVLPLILLSLKRANHYVRTSVLFAIFVISIITSALIVRTHQEFDFYMLPSRAWELMVGALLSVGAVPAVNNRITREIVATAGFIAVLCPIFLYSDQTPFPGLAAVPPVFGAAMMIHCALGTVIGRILSAKPVVFIGLISYSLYLWHWPIIVFLEYAQDSSLSGMRSLLAICLAVTMATLSWRFVEKPFRSGEVVSKRGIFIAASMFAVVVTTLSIFALMLHGWPQRFPSEILAMDAGAAAASPRRQACHWEEGQGLGNRSPCVLGASVLPSAALWGDSHGVELSFAIGEILKQRGASIAELTSSSCPPALGVEGPGRRGCPAQNKAVLAWINANPSVRTVILAAYWANSALAGEKQLPNGLIATVTALKRLNRQVIVVGAIPPNAFSVPRRLAHLAQQGRLDGAYGSSRATLSAETSYLAPTFALLRSEGVPIVAPVDVLCPDEKCALLWNNKPLYFDYHHLSVAGASLIAPRIVNLIGTNR